VFSANLQETLGISWYEGALVDAIPMVPDRLSYKEMAMDEFKYPSEYTDTWENYKKNKDMLMAKIHHYMESYNNYRFTIDQQVRKLKDDFFGAGEMINMIRSRNA
jgi:hypothetical protein